MSGQLEMEVEQPFTFLVVCAACSEHLAEIPVDNGDWREAEAWCFVADRKHREVCPERHAS